MVSIVKNLNLYMKTLKVFLIILILFINSLSAQEMGYFQRGTILENQEIQSQILGRAVAYSVYLPPDYETSNRSYPIVYLLHGYTDDETAWVQFGEVQVSADEGIAKGEIPPMIIVMPDGGVSFYINDYDGDVPWETMFIEEFIPDIEDKYRVRRKKEFRGISGLSMGGYGSTILAMRHNKFFASCAAFSSAYRSDEELINMPQESYDRIYGRLYGEKLEGKKRLTDHWYQYSALHQAEMLPEEELKSVKWYIDCGDDDFLYKGNSLMHIILSDRQIPHEYRVRDGAHTWSYWRTGIRDGLRFIGKSFHR